MCRVLALGNIVLRNPSTPTRAKRREVWAMVGTFRNTTYGTPLCGHFLFSAEKQKILTILECVTNPNAIMTIYVGADIIHPL